VFIFVNLHCATFAYQRAITSALFILGHALIWIFVLHKEAGFFLKTQTLPYILFYSIPSLPSLLSSIHSLPSSFCSDNNCRQISIFLSLFQDILFLIAAIVASYTRELAHRRVYFVVDQVLNFAAQLKSFPKYLNHSSSSNLSSSSSSTASFPNQALLSSSSSVVSVLSSSTVAPISSSPSLNIHEYTHEDTREDAYEETHEDSQKEQTEPPTELTEQTDKTEKTEKEHKAEKIQHEGNSSIYERKKKNKRINTNI
jgi:hypothetical protein